MDLLRISLQLLSGIVALITIYKYVSGIIKLRVTTRSLAPYYSEQEVKDATKNFIETKCQNIAPSRDLEPGRTHAYVTKEDLIPFFFKVFEDNYRNDQKFYLLLADAGMGKTTFLINLFQRYSQISVRKYAIRLFPLSSTTVLEEIAAIPINERTNCILLLDSFDEDLKAVENYSKRIDEICNVAWRFRYILLASRTQFFPNEDKEPSEINVRKFGGQGGFHTFYKMYVSPFDSNDIKTYINKKFPFWQKSIRSKAKGIVEKCPDLMVRPMLLMNVDKLLNTTTTYRYTFELYDQLIEAWVNREANRKRAEERDLFKSELLRFSREMALLMSRSGKFLLKPEVLIPIASKHNIVLSDIDLRSRSLLNRDAQGRFKFSHRSIMEYLVAQMAFEDIRVIKRINFKSITQALNFFRQMSRKLSEKVPNIQQNAIESLNVTSGSIFAKNIRLLPGAVNLKYLQIHHAKWGASKCHLLKFSWGIKSLIVSDSHFGSWTFLKSLEQLEVLILRNTNFSSSSLLDQCLDLRELSITNSPMFVLDDSFTIDRLERLNKIDFSFNRVEVNCNFSIFRNVQRLNLRSNVVKSITSLYSLKSLKYLNVLETNLEIGAVTELVKKLPYCLILSDFLLEILDLKIQELVNWKFTGNQYIRSEYYSINYKEFQNPFLGMTKSIAIKESDSTRLYELQIEHQVDLQEFLLIIKNFPNPYDNINLDETKRVLKLIKSKI